MVMRFPAKENAGCPKVPRNSLQERWHSPPPIGLPWDSPPLPTESVRAYGRTLTSEPKFLGSIGLPNFLTRGAPLKIVSHWNPI